MGTNLASIVTESAARDADAPAVRLGDRTLTYGELATAPPAWRRCCASTAWGPATGSA